MKAAVMRDKLMRMMTDLRIKLYMWDDGVDATDALAELAMTVGPVCIGAIVGLPREPWINQMRGAMTSIQDMCLHGYRWKSVYAVPLNNALDLALEHLRDIPLKALLLGSEQSILYSQLISSHQVTQETLAI